MAEPTTVTQVAQIGVESTPGTAVAANRRLPSLQVSIGPEMSFTEVMAAGMKFPAQHALGKEWCTAELAMPVPSYDELVYLFANAMSYASPTQQASTTAYKWTSTIASDSEDTVKRFTLEHGSSVRARKFAYGTITDLTLKGDRDKVELSGSMIGQSLSDGITMTSSPTVIAQVPVLAKDVSVYADDTGAGLGTTKLTRVLSWELSIKNRFSPLWVVDAAQSSWAAAVETPVQAELKLKVAADSTGMALLTTTARGSASKFVRISASSSTLAGTAIPYALTIDTACQVKGSPSKFEDADGLYALEYTFGLVHDATWGKALTIDTMCKRTSL